MLRADFSPGDWKKARSLCQALSPGAQGPPEAVVTNPPTGWLKQQKSVPHSLQPGAQSPGVGKVGFFEALKESFPGPSLGAGGFGWSQTCHSTSVLLSCGVALCDSVSSPSSWGHRPLGFGPTLAWHDGILTTSGRRQKAILTDTGGGGQTISWVGDAINSAMLRKWHLCLRRFANRF